MRRAIIILAAGIILGAASAAAIIRFGAGWGGVRIGPWSTPLDAGGTGRGLYVRAMVARWATLGLSRKETIYFIANQDDAGRSLDGACSYHITGADLPARWWSITLYDGQHYLLPTPTQRYSFASANLQRAPGGDIDITLSPTASPGNWLDTAKAPRLVVLLRLYQPHAAEAANPASLHLPSITRTGCAA